MFEFYQPDEVLMLEDLIADDGGTDPESQADRHTIAMVLHRAIADLPSVERRVLYRLHLDNATIAETADLFGLTEAEVAEIAENAGARPTGNRSHAASASADRGSPPLGRRPNRRGGRLRHLTWN